MKKTFITLIILATFTVAKAQQFASKGKDSTAIKIDTLPLPSVDKSPIFTGVEHEPEFLGGKEKLHKFLQDNIRYPAEAFERKKQGKVFVAFVVEKDGSLTDIE